MRSYDNRNTITKAQHNPKNENGFLSKAVFVSLKKSILRELCIIEKIDT